jgi:glycosyltransferase 2 family protein
MSSGSSTEATPPSRSLGATFLKVVVTLGLYVAVFYKVDRSALWTRLESAQLGWVALGVLCYAAGQWTSAWRWWILLAPVRLAVPFLRMVAFYFVGMFFNMFLPTIVGGDAVKAILLTRETGAPARSTVSVFMERNVGLAALFVIATTSAWLAPPVTVLDLPLRWLVVLLFSGFIGANIVIFNPRAYRVVDRVIARTPLAGTRSRTASFYDALLPYRRAPGPLAASLALSFLFQVVVILVVFLNGKALSHDVPVLALAVFVPLISLAGMVPVSVNGLGLREALYVLLFGRIGTPADVALLMALLYFAVTLLASLPGGIVYMLQPGPRSAPGQRGSHVPTGSSSRMSTRRW